MEYEIILAGVVDGVVAVAEQPIIVEASEAALDGRLALLRNLSAGQAKGDILVFVDDDIIFPIDWVKRLLRFSQGNPWRVLGNRILLPDGGRYWDRATISPHRLVAYDHPDNDPDLYQCGCFWVMRREVFESEKWDDDIVFYSERTGGTNEDVEYSSRLVRKGYALSFDKENYVWHWDDNYAEWFTANEGLRTIRKEEITRDFHVDRFPDISREFLELLDHLDSTICAGRVDRT